MPCLGNHHHRPWPKSGKQRLLIEACETHCGWCEYSTRHANNLRVHARRHVANPADDSLRDIAIVSGKAGRSRVALRSEASRLPPSRTGPAAPLASSTHTVQSEADHDEQLRRRVNSLEQLLLSLHESTRDTDLLLSRVKVLRDMLIDNDISVPPPSDPRLRDLESEHMNKETHHAPTALSPSPEVRPIPAPPPPPSPPPASTEMRRESRKPNNMRISVRPETVQQPPHNEQLVRNYRSDISRSVARDKNDTETRFPSTVLEEPQKDHFNEDHRNSHYRGEPNPWEASLAAQPAKTALPTLPAITPLLPRFDPNPNFYPFSESDRNYWLVNGERIT